MVCFVHFDFDFDICFAPQRRALFQHLNFQKCSEPAVFSASCHSGVQFFISHLPRWLRTRRFSEPTFWPSGARKRGKTYIVFTASELFYLFARLHPLSSDSFSSLIFFFSSLHLCFSILLFHLSILSEVWLLNFLRSKPDAHAKKFKPEKTRGKCWTAPFFSWSWAMTLASQPPKSSRFKPPVTLLRMATLWRNPT